MGLKVVLSGVNFTDTTLPKLEKDPMLNAGSLILIDFANPSGWTSGSTLPVNNDLIPNIAWEKAAALLGSGTASSLSNIFRSALTGTSSSKHKEEFTTKKAFHGIVSQNPGVANQENFRIEAAAAIRQYLLDSLPETGSGRDFFLSMWYKTTRIAAHDTTVKSHFASTTSNFAYYMSTKAQEADIGDVLSTDSRLTNPNTADTLSIRNVHFNGFRGVKTGGILTTQLVPAAWGSHGAWAGTSLTTSGSYILYRYYLEDLTASGRTYAQADAQDQAMYNEAFGVGGRFYGDTYTSPSTLA